MITTNTTMRPVIFSHPRPSLMASLLGWPERLNYLVASVSRMHTTTPEQVVECTTAQEALDFAHSLSPIVDVHIVNPNRAKHQ